MLSISTGLNRKCSSSCVDNIQILVDTVHSSHSTFPTQPSSFSTWHFTYGNPATDSLTAGQLLVHPTNFPTNLGSALQCTKFSRGFHGVCCLWYDSHVCAVFAAGRLQRSY